jgi:tripartite-type tricarboxylate transporter receptor subunit TctC
MKLPRRKFLQLAGVAAVAPTFLRVATAQTYPTRPVRIIVGNAAGGSTDFAAREMGQWLSERFGHPFIVENRPSAGGIIGIEAVARAPADGYTLHMSAQGNAVNATLYATLYEKHNLSFIRDIAPVAGVMRFPLVIVVNPSVPVKTVAEFIAYAKANPGKLNMGSGGVGGPQHVAGELFKMMTGVNLVHVPYRGGAPAVADLLGGQVQVMFGIMPESIEHIRAGKLRSLAVTTATRSAALPDVPTIGEFVAGYEAEGWHGLGAPKNTPTEIVNKLNNEINAGLADPRIKARFAEFASTEFPGSPLDFGKFIAEETDKWRKVVKLAGIKAD